MSLWEKIKDSSRPPVIIAEFGDSHFGSLDRAKEMVRAAKDSGADVVKFQHHIVTEEMLPDIPSSSNMKEPLWDFLLANALKIEDHEELAKLCKEVGITYLCTPFSLKAAQELEQRISPEVYKIGSGELLDHPTIREIARFGKPIILSTGMASPGEIRETYELMLGLDVEFAFLNCTSGYPPKLSEANLGFLKEMPSLYPSAVIGSSDHFPDLLIAQVAVTQGARIIEKHVTDGGPEYGPDTLSSISLQQLRGLRKTVDELFESMQTPKQVHESEHEIRAWAHRSLVYLRDIQRGEVASEADIWGKRPGTGIPVRMRHLFIGRTLTTDVKANTLVEIDDFE